jgi:hypothetical protein
MANGDRISRAIRTKRIGGGRVVPKRPLSGKTSFWGWTQETEISSRFRQSLGAAHNHTWGEVCWAIYESPVNYRLIRGRFFYAQIFVAGPSCDMQPF